MEPWPPSFQVKVTPRADRDAVVGWQDDGKNGRILVVRLRAAPVEGKANVALLRLLAKEIGVAPSRVTLLRGVGSRWKTVEWR